MEKKDDEAAKNLAEALKHLAKIAILKGRHIKGQLPYSGRPGNPFFYHGRIVYPDSIIPDQDSQDTGVNSPYLGEPAHGGEFTPLYPDPGFERNALPQAMPNPPSVHFDRPLLQPIADRLGQDYVMPPPAEHLDESARRPFITAPPDKLDIKPDDVEGLGRATDDFWPGIEMDQTEPPKWGPRQEIKAPVLHFHTRAHVI